MVKLSILRFHEYMRGSFKQSVLLAYRSHRIFCEADLQSFAWHKIHHYLRQNEEARGKVRVLNKPFLRKCYGTYPDLVVFRGNKPWAVIELKETKRLTVQAASAEREKLAKARKKLNYKRGYLVYVARYGDKRVLKGVKGKRHSYHFFEVPIVLFSKITKHEDREAWRKEFKRWSKYVRA